MILPVELTFERFILYITNNSRGAVFICCVVNVSSQFNIIAFTVYVVAAHDSKFVQLFCSTDADDAINSFKGTERISLPRKSTFIFVKRDSVPFPIFV